MLSFKQLVEWLNTELVPCAKQDQSLAAWTKLAFRGDVNDYLAQFDKLTLCYPMSHDMTLQYATEPLGTAFYHSAKRANMHYGQIGMTYRDLCNYIEHYLKELKSGDLKLLTERSMSRGCYCGVCLGVSRRGCSDDGVGKMVYITITTSHELLSIYKQLGLSLPHSSPGFPDWIFIWKNNIYEGENPTRGCVLSGSQSRNTGLLPREKQKFHVFPLQNVVREYRTTFRGVWGTFVVFSPIKVSPEIRDYFYRGMCNKMCFPLLKVVRKYQTTFRGQQRGS